MEKMEYLFQFQTLVYFVNIYLGILVNKQKNDIEFINQIISVYQGKIKEINGLKERKDMALSRAEVINSLQAKRGRVIAILDGLIENNYDAAFEYMLQQADQLGLKKQ